MDASASLEAQRVRMPHWLSADLDETEQDHVDAHSLRIRIHLCRVQRRVAMMRRQSNAMTTSAFVVMRVKMLTECLLRGNGLPEERPEHVVAAEFLHVIEVAVAGCHHADCAADIPLARETKNLM